jgi:hypothetical protein
MGDEEDHIGSPDLEMRVAEGSSGALGVCISEKPDRRLFDEIANVLAQKSKGQWTAKHDDDRQRSWDLVVGDVTVTLHFDRYRGIWLSAAKQNPDMEKANGLVLEMARMVREQVE